MSLTKANEFSFMVYKGFLHYLNAEIIIGEVKAIRDGLND